jgi:hypothetical protein
MLKLFIFGQFSIDIFSIEHLLKSALTSSGKFFRITFFIFLLSLILIFSKLGRSERINSPFSNSPSISRFSSFDISISFICFLIFSKEKIQFKLSIFFTN